jgi:hypothetical protein
MQLSRTTDQPDPTSARLLPVKAIASAERAQTLARDELRALALTAGMLPVPMRNGTVPPSLQGARQRDVDRTKVLARNDVW